MKYQISFARYKLDKAGKKSSAISTSKSISAPSPEVAMEMIKSQHPGYHIEFRNIKEK